MDRGAWQAMVREVTKRHSWACLSFSQQTDRFCMNISKASWKRKKPFGSSQDDGCNMDDQAQGRNWETGYLALDSCWAMMLPVAPQVYRVRFEGKPLLEQVSIFLQGPGRGLSVQFSRLVVSDSLQPRELQHARPPCLSPSPGVHPNSCASSWWCHPTIILCRPLLLLPPVPPSIRVFSNESTLHMRWPKYWSFSFSISPSKEHTGLISFRMDWLDLLAVLYWPLNDI